MKTNLEVLLGEWGRWQAGMNRSGLGYPSETSFSKMRVDCGRHSGVNVLLVDDDIRELDAAIQRLHPDVRVVITAHYVWPGVLKVKLGRLSVSRTAFYESLDFAHKQLSHDMGGAWMCGYEPAFAQGMVAA